MGMRRRLIEAGFGVIGATRLHRIVAPLTRGSGAILMFHHVRPQKKQDFAPNALLEITPDFLEATLQHLRRSNYPILTLDQAMQRLRTGEGRSAKPFAVLTFDDGYRNIREWALPILERHEAPATFYITTGYADRTARLWWFELEEAIRRANRVSVSIRGAQIDVPAGTGTEKQAAFDAVYWRLRQGSEEDLLAVVADLCARSGVDGRALVEADCMGWDEIDAVARHPLITIGGHTLSHPMLAKHGAERMRHELSLSKHILEERLGRSVSHLAYPVGDPTSAGPREFDCARAVGYATGVTTRPGLLFPEHADHVMALPRVSVNGNHQSLGSLDILLSGAAFALWNRGIKVNTA